MNSTKKKMKTGWLNVRAVYLALLFLAYSAKPALASDFAGEGAPTLGAGRVEVGVFSAAKWGVTDRVELGAHPLGIFLWPSVRGKIQWWQGGSAHSGHDASIWLSSLHRISVPTPFLNLIAREGAAGLLPPNADVPFAVQLENSALLSLNLRGHLATAQAGVGVAISQKSDLPMVEFPFLYTTLAPLYSPVTFRWAVSLEGVIAGPFDYQLIHRMNLWRPREELAWPSESGPPWVYAQETAVRAHYRLNERHRLSLGATVAVAHYPIGYRLNWIPTLDYRVVVF
jgi:hypothetical protein